MPSLDEVRTLLTYLTRTIPKEEDFDLEAAALALEGRPLSDAAFLIRESARLAARSGRTALDPASLKKATRNLPDRPDTKGRTIGFRRD